MNPAVVVDVGNSRMKWGLCSATAISAMAALPGEDKQAWQKQIDDWQLLAAQTWVLGGVHPARRDRLADWLSKRGERVISIEKWTQLPIQVHVDRPEQVGLDRLFNAVAAKSAVARGVAALVIDAGTAITVNWIDESGAFRGGAILPGMATMAQALHQATSQLPLSPVPTDVPTFPGTSTVTALQAGIYWSAVGAVEALRGQCEKLLSPGAACELFLTGGDAALLAKELSRCRPPWPEMTLEGIRLTAQHLP